MHLNVLITLFQKMLWFIGVWATNISDISDENIKKDADSAEIWQVFLF